MEKVIEVKNLCKTYEFYKKKQGIKGSLKNFFKRETLKKEAVKDINFSIEKGEIVGFLGPNGAGKTTTLKMLSGILFPTEGSIEILGFDPSKRENKFKEKISIVMGQKNQLWWDLPAVESFYLIKKIYNISDENYNKRLNEMTELLDVKELLEIQVRKLSLGERMKMEIIASLLHDPQVLFLDEPTIGLDIVSQKRIREFLRYYNQKEKTTIILTSHYMEDIKSLCNRCIVIAKGKIVFDNELEELIDLDNTKILKLKLGRNTDKETLEKYGKLVNIKESEVTLEVEKEYLKEVIAKLFSDLDLLDITVEDTPIENNIENLYKIGC